MAQKNALDCWPLLLVSFTETTVRNNHYSLRNGPEERIGLLTLIMAKFYRNDGKK